MSDIFLEGSRYTGRHEVLPSGGQEDLGDGAGTLSTRDMLDPGDLGLVRQLDKRMREKSPHSPPSDMVHSSETRDDRPSEHPKPSENWEREDRLHKEAVKLALSILKWAVFDGNSLLGPSVAGESSVGGGERYTPENQFQETARRAVDDGTELGRTLKREEIIPPTGRGSASRGNDGDAWTQSLLRSMFRVFGTTGPAHNSPLKVAGVPPPAAGGIVDPMDENELATLRYREVPFRNYGPVKPGPGSALTDDNYTPPNVLRGEIPPSVERTQPERAKVSFLLALMPSYLEGKLR